MTYNDFEEKFFRFVNEITDQICTDQEYEKFKEVLPDLDVQPHLRMAWAMREGCPCQACLEASDSLLVTTCKMYFAKKHLQSQKVGL